MTSLWGRVRVRPRHLVPKQAEQATSLCKHTEVCLKESKYPNQPLSLCLRLSAPNQPPHQRTDLYLSVVKICRGQGTFWNSTRLLPQRPALEYKSLLVVGEVLIIAICVRYKSAMHGYVPLRKSRPKCPNSLQLSTTHAQLEQQCGGVWASCCYWQRSSQRGR